MQRAQPGVHGPEVPVAHDRRREQPVRVHATERVERDPAGELRTAPALGEIAVAAGASQPLAGERGAPRRGGISTSRQRRLEALRADRRR